MIEIDTFVESDSLDRVELIMALEEAFDVSIPDNDRKRMRTVRHALELMDRLKAMQGTKKQ